MLALEGQERDRFVKAVALLNDLINKHDRGYVITDTDLCKVIEILKGRE